MAQDELGDQIAGRIDVESDQTVDELLRATTLERVQLGQGDLDRWRFLHRFKRSGICSRQGQQARERRTTAGLSRYLTPLVSDAEKIFGMPK